ncbi:MAG TPA: helicase C-terminal domain-containing protein [Syntrophomonadaceae bacterium]|nr:helicase C-terminal domain-containing protein [Syntrophomonadaceae bacterium]
MELITPAVSEYFQDGNALSNLIDDYIYRADQAELADEIYKSFFNKEFLVAEAGTGVGKTYAYLFPSVIWATTEGEKVVISTRTKALQEQLIERDLPNVLKTIKTNIRVAEAKGRENYLCWNKYMNILAGKREMSPSETVFIERILGWAERTKSGDKKELNLQSELMNQWWIVAADRKSCAKEACKYHDKCFRLKMIRSLDNAGIIVVNHALLLSDVMVDNSILPEYKYLIIDEAHNIDREAFTRLSNRATFTEMQDILKGIYYKPFDKGHLGRLKKELPDKGVIIDECKTLVDRTKVSLNNFQASIQKCIKQTNREQSTRIITNDIVESEKFIQVHDSYLELIEVLNRLIYQLEMIKSDDSDFILLNSLLRESSDTLFKIMEEDLQSNVSLVWVEWRKGEIESLVSSVIEIGTALHESLYEKLESLIMVSATLTIDDKFDFFITKSGLSNIETDERLKTFISHSPFSYDKQAKLLVIDDLPEPQSEKFSAEIALLIKEIINITRGRTLILFTARKQMKYCADVIRPFALENNIELLVQNEDGEATNILNSFMANSNSVLMGLDSFWEGVDLKGDMLTCLVIVKLPFKPPTDPFSSAYDKHCTNQGLSTFMTFSLPDAVMRFKQGLGRLIRSESDHGVAIVLDNRIITKRYGASFRRSIPIKNVHNINQASIKDFLQKKG